MKKPDLSFPFVETQNQYSEMSQCIDQYVGKKGAQMPILQEAQRIYGYLPLEVLERIAERTGFPLEELYSTATFYSQFSFVPKGKYTVSVCMGTACYVKGAGDILSDFSKKLGIEPGETTQDGKFSLESCRCIGACGLAPVLTVNEEVYGRLGQDGADKVLVNYQDLPEKSTSCSK